MQNKIADNNRNTSTNPHNLTASKIFEQNGQYQLAWMEAIKSIKQHPFHPEAYIQMASAAFSAKDPKSALIAAKRALDLTPNWPMAIKTVQTLEQYIKKNPNTGIKNCVQWPSLPPANLKPRLSVCMITKNEEIFLDQCLKSLKDVAYEIIIIDTGSSDRTIQIANQHGIQVGFFEWCDDFAAARNVSIAQATGDWILILDADEEICRESVEQIPSLLSQKDVSLYRVGIQNQDTGSRSKTYVPRLFRNIAGLQFIGRVHETILPTLEFISHDWGLRTPIGNMLLIHHGYTDSVVQSRNKVERNYNLLKRAVEEFPRAPHYRMHLGLELMRMEQVAESFAEYSQAFNLLNTDKTDRESPEVRETLITQYSTYLFIHKKYSETINILDSDLAKRNGLTPGQLMIRSSAFLNCGRLSEALRDAIEAYNRRDEPTFSPQFIDPKSLAMEALVGESYYVNRQFNDAIGFLKTALQSEKPELRTVLAYAECLSRTGKIGEALEHLHQQALSVNDQPEIWIIGFKIAQQNPALLDIAIEWLQEAILHFPNDPILNRFKSDFIDKPYQHMQS
jgi:glycosyltransferase involved in cell wall biosynthesis